MFTMAFVVGKFKETLFLFLAYSLTRNSFDKQLHLSTDKNCIKATCVIFAMAIIIIIPYDVSIIFTSVIGVVINYVCSIFMLIPFKSNKNKRDIVLSYVNNDEDEIEEKCRELNLLNVSETVYLFLNNSYEEVSAILNIETSTVRRRVDRFIDKLTNA